MRNKIKIWKSWILAPWLLPLYCLISQFEQWISEWNILFYPSLSLVFKVGKVNIYMHTYIFIYSKEKGSSEHKISFNIIHLRCKLNKLTHITVWITTNTLKLTNELHKIQWLLLIIISKWLLLLKNIFEKEISPELIVVVIQVNLNVLS